MWFRSAGSAVPPGQLYRREGLSEKNARLTLPSQWEKRTAGGGRFCLFLSRLPTTRFWVRKLKNCRCKVVKIAFRLA